MEKEEEERKESGNQWDPEREELKMASETGRKQGIWQRQGHADVSRHEG